MKKLLEKTRGWKLPFLATIGVFFTLFVLLSYPKSKNNSPLIQPPSSSFRNTTAGIGVIEPASKIIHLAPPVPGLIQSVHVCVGDRVEKGATLFKLDQRDIDAQITTLQSRLEVAKVQLAKASAAFEIVNSIQNKTAISKDLFNQRKYDQLLTVATLNEIEAKLEQAQVAKRILTIEAPIDGEILEVNALPGEFATAQEGGTPLISLGDVSSLNVRVEFDQEVSSFFNPTSEAYGLLRGDTQTKIPLTFLYVEPYVRPKQNLETSSQRIDTRVLQVVYQIKQEPMQPKLFTGLQMDVFVENKEDETL